MIDLTYLNDITDGDAEAKRQIISLFLTQAEEIMQRFDAARNTGDIDEIGRIAHLAKSTSKVMGISGVSEKMQELQLLADRHEQTERYDELINVYFNDIPVALDELRQVLGSL